MTRKEHWEGVYASKQPQEVSWTQQVPTKSLEMITELGVSSRASVIDVGGGDSKLVDHLLDLGFSDVTVLDISSHAIERAKARLGKRVVDVNWVVSDINEFTPHRSYDLWHDRATFHFLTNDAEVERYVKIVSQFAARHVILGTFSTDGPLKCSGLEVRQYNEDSMTAALGISFNRVKCIRENHITPFGTQQNFLFCGFNKSIEV